MSDEAQAQEMRAKIADHVANKGLRKTPKKAWAAPTVMDFVHGTVLALDQTLTSTGFSIVHCDYTGLYVLEGGVMTPKIDSGIVGFEETFAKAENMGLQFDAMMVTACMRVQTIVHEMPAVSGHRIESSLMAAREVRRAASQYARGTPVVMISSQTMRAILNPPFERKEKKHVKSAIETLIPQGRITARRWNEHVCDSVGLALAYLYQQGKS